MTPIHVAHKDSDIAERTRRSQTQQFKDIGQMICGSEALQTKTANIIKSFDNESRDVIINNLNTIKIPADEMTAMKNEFEPSLEPCQGWIGTGLCTEEIPATVKKSVLRLC